MYDSKRDPAAIQPRSLTKFERSAFWPRGMSHTHDEEIGYRRGFDQGVAALARALGIKSGELQEATWMQKVSAFRRGAICECPYFPDTEERVELCLLLPGSTPTPIPE